jgi:hypothetical protein
MKYLRLANVPVFSEPDLQCPRKPVSCCVVGIPVVIQAAWFSAGATMPIISIVGYIVGVVGIIYGVRCYYNLWRWARLCQNTSIAIEYKGRVKTRQPITEWLLWGNMLDRDKDSNGRIMYHEGGTRIAIIRSWKGDKTRLRDMIGEAYRAINRARMNRKTSAPAPRAGKMKATDDTPQKNRVREAIK